MAAFDAGAFDSGAFDTGLLGGGWLTPEQAAAQLREIKRQEAEEEARLAEIKARALELEKTIVAAYDRATGKVQKALEGIETPPVFTPETVYEVGREVVERVSRVLESTGRRHHAERRRMTQLSHELAEFEALLRERERLQQEDDDIAARLLLSVV